ncbi:oxidoreductase [Reinekea marina]|uniref:Oxidoreductase n=1 Tax=Reinekea marina TaxID=1310421 RepID=A0ABV7WS70_9GAMM|nr:oxidoreductase [Reinekea marina]MDN3649101.1 oxidoreductase [Reinekea marina]
MSNQAKVALVTGASSGMGKDFAKALLDEGYVVYTAARRLEQMDDLQKLGAIAVKMDITKEEEIQNLVSQIETHHGAVDVLVNNAGFGLYGAMEDTSIEDARYQFEVNIFGLARLTQLLLPKMRDQKTGRIINISSMGGKMYTPLGSWYHATKHALEGWSDCLRIELAPFGIDVVIIEPGAIVTEFGDVVLEPMLKRSGQSAYSEMAQAMANATRESYQNGKGSPVSVITKLLVKAVRAKKPKTRYVGGLYAKPILFIRRIVSDKVFDRIVAAMVK